MDRRHWCLAAAGLLAGCGGVPVRRAPDSPAGSLPPFSAMYRGAVLPAGWLPHVMRRDRAPTRYSLDERDGRAAVHAIADRSTSGLRCDVDIDPKATPWLSWEWRVDQVPAGASVEDDDRDDSPARVVVAFDGDVSTLSLRDRLFRDTVELFTGTTLPFATLMYVWDAKAPPESVVAYPRTARVQYLVVESGAERAGRWLGYRRNVLADYRRVFGGEPGRIRHVGLLADTDDLKVRTDTWFANLAFSAA